MPQIIKLLMGGSPCTYWSIAQSKERETKPTGLGWELFLNFKIAIERYRPDYFLYENNKSMSKDIRAQITRELGVEPVLINSALVSAQCRQRLYWVGRREPDDTYSQVHIEQPEDRGILVRDILEDGFYWREKAYTLKATYYKDGIRNMVGNNIDRKTCVAHSVRIGTIENTAKDQEFDHKAYRVYSPDGKGVTLCGEGGGAGAKTGLYAAPVRVGDMPTKNGTVTGCQEARIYSEDGKAAALMARTNGGGFGGPLYAVPTGAARRGRGDGSQFEIRDDQKSNALTADGHQSRLVIENADGGLPGLEVRLGRKTYPIYEVQDGYITVKGKRFPIKLTDGFYIIRKLTVTECKRLQTVPDSYVFPVSNTQAYRMLGNGWTVDVITHILRHIPGISYIPVEALSMYDGMSCGHLALDKLGANVTTYYATETDKYAVQTTMANYPNTVQLGDAFQVREDQWKPTKI